MKNKIFYIMMLFLAIMSFSSSGSANKLESEKWYQENTCQGKTEVFNRFNQDISVRVDCLEDDYAIEYDFAKKWTEAVGQSLSYAMLLGKKPAIRLIITVPKDISYAKLLKESLVYMNINIRVQYIIKSENGFHVLEDINQIYF